MALTLLAMTAAYAAAVALLDRDILTVDENQLLTTRSVLTVVDGKLRLASDEFKALAPALPKAMPAWSPVYYYP